MEIQPIRLVKRSRTRLKHWTSWIGYAAMLWSLIYGLMHFYWFQGGEGYPFTQEEMGFLSALVTYLPFQLSSFVFVALCTFGIFFGMAIHQSWGRVIPNWLILIFAWGSASFLLFLIPDISLIAGMAYAFLLKFRFNWLMFNQMICIIGALLWIFAAVSYHRSVQHACMYCGRIEDRKSFIVVQWGKWITYIAALAPLPYAFSRFAWALGIPFGVEDDFLEEMSKANPMATLTEWVFGGICIGGGLLTLGLIQKWGEELPHWFPFFGGKKVPILLAVIPAAIVSIAITAAGFVFTFVFFAFHFQLIPAEGILLGPIWGTIGPMLLWIPWGVALGLAAIAYYYRRRGQCDICKRVG